MIQPTDTFPPLAHIVQNLAEKGYSVAPDFLPAGEVAQLRQETLALAQQGALHRAGVGKGRLLQDETRGDLVRWLDADNASDAQRAYLQRLETLRQAVNRDLFLGLFDFEGHLALYPPGAFYRKHLDQFQGNNQRTLSCILYLNHDWKAQDGGELRLHLDDDTHLDILPQGGTLVAFLSSRFQHEVLPASRQRASITGWFKTRDKLAA